jgi:hypothetical protein
MAGSGDLGGEQFFDGAIDDFMIFNQPLPATDVATLYNNGQGTCVDPSWAAARGLAIGYHFDQTGGSTVQDFSGTGDHEKVIAGRTFDMVALFHRDAFTGPVHSHPVASGVSSFA